MKIGDRVKLKATTECPEEYGEIVGPDGGGTWVVQVAPDGDDDDGLRGGITEDEMEPL